MFTRKDIKAAVDDMVISANIHGLPLEKILLYGSYAKGTPHKYSDIDLAVFSSRFVENPHTNIELIQCTRRLPQMSIQLYQMSDYYDHPFVEEIKKHAVVLRNEEVME